MNMSSQTAAYQRAPTLEEFRSIRVVGLPYWADENYLRTWFAHAAGEILSVKVIRNRITGQPEGYGFLEFASHQVAERVLQSYNGTQIPGTELTFRLSWGSPSLAVKRNDGRSVHSLFVGNLAPNVTDYLLQETFRASYPSVQGAKVLTEPNTRPYKGYGFVRFADEMERNRAMVEMNGVYCCTRPMRIRASTTPKKTADLNQLSAYYAYGQGYDAYAYGAFQDPSAYAHGAYGGYAQYPHQTEGAQDLASLSGIAPMMEQDDVYDLLATPDVNKLNTTYLGIHGNAILGRYLWQITSAMQQQT